MIRKTDDEKTPEELKLELEFLRGEVYILRHFMAGMTSYQTYKPYLQSVALWNYAWCKKYFEQYPNIELGSIPEAIGVKAREELPLGHAIYADVVGKALVE